MKTLLFLHFCLDFVNSYINKQLSELDFGIPRIFDPYLATIYPLLTLLIPNFKTVGILAFNNRGPLLVLSTDFWSYFTHPDKLCQYIKYIEHYMHVHCMLVHCTYVSSRRFITWTPRIYCVDRQWGLGKSMPFWIIYRVTSIYWYDFRRSLWGHGLIQKKCLY